MTDRDSTVVDSTVADSVADQDGPQAAASDTGTANRRAVLVGAGALGAAGLLAACGGDGPATPSGSAEPAPPTGEAPPAEPPGGPGTSDGPDAPEEPAGDLAIADVPVGGGIVLQDRDTIVTQPAAGDFRAFSATCTHMSCALSRIEGDRISCFCHGSQFSIADGSVVRGPANRPLAPRQVTVTGDTLAID